MIEELSVEVGELAVTESSPEERDDMLLEEALFGYISGALYESIFVVEISSRGAEIALRLIVP